MKNYLNEIDDAIGKQGRILPDCLQGYKPVEGDGICVLYECYPGGICVVYPLECQGKPQKCIRLWHKSQDGHDKEYIKKVASELGQLQREGIEFLMGYKYYEKGLQLNDGEVIPAVVMDWVKGDTLIDFIQKNCNNHSDMRQMANVFFSMVSLMNRNGLAHGDLSGSNIMVKPNKKMMLIDYDSFFIPSSMPNNLPQKIKGTAGYQHPGRKAAKYMTSDMDYFSQQVIYLTLLAVAENPALANESNNLVSDKKMLFDERDLASEEAFITSPGYKAVAAINNTDVRLRLAELREAVKGRLENVRSIVEFNTENRTRRFEQNEKNRTLREEIIGRRDEHLNTGATQTAPQREARPQANTQARRSQSQTPTVTPWYKKWYTWAVVAALVIGLMYYQKPFNGGDTNPTQTEVSIAPALNKLEGNYTLREKNAGTLVNGIRTAAIKKESDTQARILVTSEYGPEFYDFTITVDGKIQSEQLGTGDITYNERLDKVTLTFKQGERLCEFTK